MQRSVLIVFLAIAVVGANVVQAGESSRPPYPPSAKIKQLVWDDAVVKLTPGAGDNWPITWVKGDLQITSLGDGPGFGNRKPRLSLGFATVRGDPPDVKAQDFVSNIDTTGGGSKGIKSSGLLMVDQTLYLFVRNYKPDGKDYKHSRLAWSKDRGVTWIWAPWCFSDTFGCPEFVQFGPSYDGARDEYVYLVSQDNDDAYAFSPGIVLARVPKQSVADRDRWDFLSGTDPAGQPTWKREIASRKPIFTDPRGTERIAITYNAGLRRYMLTTAHQPAGSNAMHTPALGVFDAPEPWGPWTTVYYDDDWAKGARTYHEKFPTRWMSRDGKSMWLLFSGLDGGYYTFCLRKATLTVAGE